MEYRTLGKSGLKISEIGLGGNNFGARLDEESSVKIIKNAVDMGITFLDTAAMYANGKSEELVGKAVKGKRSKVVVATKFGNPRSLAPDEQGGSRRHIIRSVEESLQRLNTDYIDLFYLHYPDTATPIEETLRALDDLVHAGKVRYIGCSNLTAWQLSEAMWTSTVCNLEPFIAIQSRYNMLDRSLEQEVVPCCEKHGVGVIPWGPLASGFLTGKYHKGRKPPAGSRLTAPMSIYNDLITDANFDKLAKLEAFSRKCGHNVGELAIAWLLSHPWLGSVIAGAMNKEQLIDNIKAADWKLTAEDLAEINKII